MIKRITSSRWTFIKHYYGRVAKTLTLLALLIPLSVALEQLAPWYMAKMVDIINSNVADANTWHRVIELLVIIFAISLAVPVCEYLTMILFQHKAVALIGLNIRGDLFDILLKREPHFWKQHQAGDVMTKIEQVRRSIAAHSSLGEFLFGLYRPLCSMVVMLVLLARISLIFMTITLISMVICFVLFYFTAQAAKQTANEVEQKYAELFGRTIGKINHFFLIKIFGTAERETADLRKEIDGLNQISNKDVWLRKRNKSVLGLCSLLFFCILMTIAVYLWIHKQISVGDVVYIFT
ncbi:MAG: ABC transporter ATP-binding protein, partial [Alphaproteobacteria bacterium]|nr:ABC transporter ATP-binding protein [Alphaproteobacteria bacterium]